VDTGIGAAYIKTPIIALQYYRLLSSGRNRLPMTHAGARKDNKNAKPLGHKVTANKK
jgi:hypothetical protein